jgi:hypothetical protein
MTDTLVCKICFAHVPPVTNVVFQDVQNLPARQSLLGGGFKI